MGPCFPRKRNSILTCDFSPEDFTCFSATLSRKGAAPDWAHCIWDLGQGGGGDGPVRDIDAVLAIPNTSGVQARGTVAVGLISEPTRGWGPCWCHHKLAGVWSRSLWPSDVWALLGGWVRDFFFHPDHSWATRHHHGKNSTQVVNRSAQKNVLCVHSFSQCFLSAYCGPGAVPLSGFTRVTKSAQSLPVGSNQNLSATKRERFCSQRWQPEAWTMWGLYPLGSSRWHLRETPTAPNPGDQAERRGSLL